MKNILFGLVALVLLSFSSCDSGKDPRSKRGNQVDIQGQVENPRGNKVMVGKKTIMGEGKIMDSTSLQDNQFALNFDLEEPGYYTLRYGRMPLQVYLRPGDSLHLQLNPQDMDGTQFSGLGAELNNYLINHPFRTNRSWYKAPEDEFGQKLDSLKSAYNESWENFLDTAENVPEQVKKLEPQRINYKWAGQMMVYPRAHRYFTKNQDFEVSESFNEGLKNLKMEDEDLLAIPEFRRFVSEYVNKKAEEAMAGNSDSDAENAQLKAGFNVIKDMTDNQAIQDYARFGLLSQKLEQGQVKGMGTYLDQFEKEAQNQKFVKKLRDQYEQWEGLAKGKKAPTFEYPDTAGNMVSLEDFRGQYVYIDIWASWCRPCLQQIPQLKALKEKYKNQNIEIISVSIDEEKDSWKQMLDQKDLGGTQLLAEEGFKSSICQDYKISGIPRFILIDKKGRIIDVKAPRPTQNIEEVLNNLEGISGKAA